MSAAHGPEQPDDLTAGRFLSLRLAGAPVAEEVVLADRGGALRPDAVVVAREADTVAVRRVGRVTAETVELWPLEAGAPPRVVARAADAVLGTVVLRWQVD